MARSVQQRLASQGFEKLHLSMRDGTLTDLVKAPSVPSVFTVTGTAKPIKSENGMSLFGDGASYLTGAANTGYNVGTGDFTLSAWVRYSRLITSSYAVAVGWTGFLGGARIYWGNNTIYAVGKTNGGVDVVASNAHTNSIWNHVILVRASSVIYGYLNGIAMTTTAVAGANANLADHLRTRVCADAEAAAGNIMYGFVDEVFFHSAAIDAWDASIFTGETKPRD